MAQRARRRNFGRTWSRLGGAITFAIISLALLAGADTAAAQRKTCVDCHEDFKDRMSQKFVHEPARESCETCHRRHGFKQELVLVKRMPELCVDCHEDVAEQLGSEHVHAALTEGACTVCHEPHASNHKGLMREVEGGASACVQCHDELRDVLASSDTHKPFKEQDCAACHQPHASPVAGLLLDREVVVCESCHENALSKHGSPAASEFQCSECHDPHTASKKSRIAAYAHEPFASGECDACHDVRDGEVSLSDDFPPPDLCVDCHEEQSDAVFGDESHFATSKLASGGSATCLECHSGHSTRHGDLLTESEMNLCLSCHDAMPTEKTYAGIFHGPYVNGRCRECHDPHGGGGRYHLVGDTQGVCAKCHPQQSAPAAEDGFRHDAMEMVSCVDCHDPHAGQSLALLKGGGQEVCGDCHVKEHFAVSHQPYSAWNCGTCHNNHGSKKGLLAGGRKALCTSCHGEIGRAIHAAVQHEPVVDEDCSLCHASHGSDVKGLLTQPQGEICGGCHELDQLIAGSAADDGAAAQLHAPVREGDCAACHAPHGSDQPAMLIRAGESVCYGCHTEEKVDFAQGNVHKPVADGKCQQCHTPHGAYTSSLRTLKEPDLCTQCHDPLKAKLQQGHQGFDVAASTCSACHNPHNSPGEHLLNPIVHQPFADGDCSACHAPPSSLGGIAAVDKAVCTDCHDDKIAGTGHQHAGGVACTDCHSPHASKFEALLANPARLCTGCHSDVMHAELGPGQQVTLHKPIEDGSCLGCHKAHDAPAKSLLVEGQKTLCGQCHESIAARAQDATQHAPFAKGQCERCHATHASADPHLLRVDPQNLCKSCHDLTSGKMASAHGNIALSGEGCTSCHDAHSTAKASSGLMLPALHSPYEDGDCTVCHNSQGQVAAGVEVCTECHESDNGYALLHNAGRTGEELGNLDMCLDCHSPHAGYGPMFRRPSEAETCMQCHDRSEYSRSVVHPVLEDGCTTCHDVHDNNFRSLQDIAVNDLCAECHEEADQHIHPIGAEHKDPRTGAPLLCTSCHEPHSSDHKFMLTFDHRRDLCVQCHQSGTMTAH